MSGPAVVSGRSVADLEEVAKFFGIDLEWNRHVFRRAAQADSRAFEVVIGAMAEAVREDIRFGINRRVQQSIAREKTRK